jgi:LCP family protein required for cell wall assembly
VSTKALNSRWVAPVVIAIVVAGFGASGLVRATKAHLAGVNRIPSLAAVLSPPSDVVENYLLVGSDSRANADPSDADYKAIAGTSVSGQRSDSIMVLRHDKTDGSASILSVPRDLWVKIGDGNKAQRVNTAFSQGPEVLVRTIQRNLNIPVHHYLEVDFVGFKDIVDSIGGVLVCLPGPARDKYSGLYLPRGGCNVLNGQKALAYARSRHFQLKIDGDWKLDGSSDHGRTARQRDFISSLITSAVKHVAKHPLAAGDVLAGFASELSADPELDMADMIKKLRPVADSGAKSYALSTTGDNVGGASVLRLTQESDAVLAYFAGIGPIPA